MSGKKRKVDSECRTFKDSWTEQLLQWDKYVNISSCNNVFIL